MNLTIGLNMFEMTYVFGKRFEYCEKRLKYVGNDVDM